jgi:hypothetical protein
MLLAQLKPKTLASVACYWVRQSFFFSWLPA